MVSRRSSSCPATASAPRSASSAGKATLATKEMGEDILNRIMPVLVDKLKAIIAG
ncbi:hypothetical protein BPNPMPFG_005757 [Mesorhizobium sp. AR07]|uniref:hypothetical protein n=1 Tax=Mesorhizobium sp. AR07 TaxID=2865838 RepID=UPI00215ED54A|nr:hypothetical protein [Mesorhizobium sp. AR07]UVK43905.1 hypothetical protein BPNPMPFG_005757 [Mesorhizobium sp. AR07]